MTEVNIHLLGILVDEVEAFSLSLLLVLNLTALQDEGHILVALTNFAQQFQACFCIAFLHVRETACHGLHREAGITDDAQHIVGIAVIPLHRLLVVSGKHYFWASALTLCGRMGVQRLSRKILRLGKDIVVEVGQYGAIETDIILHQQYHLHTSLLDVMFDVHAVLYQFDNREDEVGITQPAEHVVEDGHILMLDTLGDTMREGGQYDTGNLRSRLLHIAGYGKGIIIGITRHTDNQVDICCLQHFLRLLGGTHLRERRGVAQSQFHILVKQFLIDASVIFQHERIIGISNYQDIEDASCH